MLVKQTTRGQHLVIWLLLLTIIAVGWGLRFYQLGQVPPGLTWDEAAIGYNAFAIWTARRDEWLHFLPISFQSFGDYKAPFAIYLLAPFVGLLGLEPWVVRLPFAVAGCLTLVLIALWIYEVLKNRMSVTGDTRLWYVLAAVVMVAFSPWHLHFSRAGFESGLALTWYVAMLWMLEKYLHQARRFGSWWWLLGASVSALGSLYTYHSAKVVIPLVCLVYGWSWLAIWRQHWRQVLGIGLVAGLILGPLFYDSVWGLGASRLAQTSVLAQELSLMVKVTTIVSNFVAHLQPSFLILGRTDTYRHGPGQWGVLFPTTATLVLLGFVLSWWQTRHSKINTFEQRHQKQLVLFAVLLVVFGILPAALGIDHIPHANRALLALPGLVLLAVIGLRLLVDWLTKSVVNQQIRGNHGERNIVIFAGVGIVVLVHAAMVISFVRHYFFDISQTSQR